MSSSPKKLTPTVRKDMLSDLQRVAAAIEHHDYDEAKRLATKVARGCASRGVKSAYVSWVLAAVADYRSEWEEAMERIQEARALDPLSLQISGSWDIIYERVRRALSAPGSAAEDESTPRLYELLLRAGEANSSSHLAMARHLDATGKHESALTLLDALVMLEPTCSEAWREKATVARKLGREQEAVQADLEGIVAEAQPVFAVPGPALG